MTSPINYTEGTCFYLPLREGGFARGIVTRLSGDGLIYVYFFGPKLARAQGAFDDARARDAVLSGICGDLGLIKGAWLLAGQLNEWSREEWPLPALYREDSEARRAWLSYYDDNTLKFVEEIPVDFEQEKYKMQPYDRVMGYGAAEIRLTKLLA